MNKNKLIVCLLVLLCPLYLYGQIEKIDQLIVDAQNVDKVPAIAVGIFQKGNVLFEKGYGYLDRYSSIATSPHSHFHLGSITKSFVSIAINN